MSSTVLGFGKMISKIRNMCHPWDFCSLVKERIIKSLFVIVALQCKEIDLSKNGAETRVGNWKQRGAFR